MFRFVGGLADIGGLATGARGHAFRVGGGVGRGTTEAVNCGIVPVVRRVEAELKASFARRF